mmetsp:Transcript_8456/g.13722  ORF Transcript_8456/g.13722 Transcript_8456/m.13722 type:complete len:518 (+) Transcript_8456:614-2167(+)|eukprot:CAMPEP_0203762698 /NCGR_PEP_ID=MMETSP0098-20131031/15518_1 /ASSEMBLY_ACC=CAM_ASM_000208 /TAXON_ID=96639 /ORGANISM=" , Strain NY0313808BC1" /LENGTH=517 /DNA_ID=CAMNT_0050657203 /DNA_START=564 /DNA_END=2117 /DNA_ORIENTATION=+
MAGRVDEACFRGAFDLAKKGQAVTGDAVYLGLGPIGCVMDPLDQRCPVIIRHLFDVQKRIDAFCACFLRTRGIITYVDLEKQVVTMLNSACVPTIQDMYNGMLRKTNPVQDESEIAVSDNDDEVFEAKVESFHEFGLGPLFMFPILRSFFGFTKVTDRFADLDTVLGYLVTFQGDEMAFCVYLAKQFGVLNVQYDLGVVIQPGSLLSYKPFLSFKPKIESNTVSPDPPPHPVVSSKVRFYGKVPRLNTKHGNSTVSTFVTSAQNALESVYSPSFSKLLNAIKDKVRPARDTLLNVATEYVMLHLGSSKHRAKRFLEEEPEEPIKACASGTEIQEPKKRQLVPSTQEPESPNKRTKFETSLLHLNRPGNVKWIRANELAPFIPSTVTLDTNNVYAIGRWGESLVYHYLQGTLRDWKVDWKNENKESLASYDLHVTCEKTNSYRTSRFIEVKTSRYSAKNAFEISLNEWEFFSKNGGSSINYEIFRVYNAGDPANVCIAVVSNPYKLLKENKIQLCIAI